MESRFLCSEFCRGIYLAALHCAMTFDDGIKHRTSDDMESAVLGSIHDKGTNAVEDSTVVPIKK